MYKTDTFQADHKQKCGFAAGSPSGVLLQREGLMGPDARLAQNCALRAQPARSQRANSSVICMTTPHFFLFSSILTRDMLIDLSERERGRAGEGKREWERETSAGCLPERESNTWPFGIQGDAPDWATGQGSSSLQFCLGCILLFVIHLFTKTRLCMLG